MGFYLRKSVRVGPIRFNLSKSGIGVSGGVKGLRVGTGPRGNYIHVGRGGFYYRKTLSTSPTTPRPCVEDYCGETEPSIVSTDSHEPLQAIDSGAVSDMVDSSSEDLVNELNSKRKKPRLWPLVAAAGIIATGFIVYTNLQPWSLFTALGVFFALLLLALYRDVLVKSVIILYDIEDELRETYECLHRSFNEMKTCKGRWHLEAEGRVRDKKYHAGADSVVERSPITLSLKNSPYVKTNVATPSIPVGSQTLYFFPR